MIDKAGADLVSLTENIDTTTAAGRMFFGVLAVMNQFERDLASERTKLAAAYKRSQGEAWATPPFGQAKDAAGRLVDVPAERRVIDEVIKLRSDGMSIRAIVAALNVRGVPTRHGGKWHIATVQRVLRRRRPAREPGRAERRPRPGESGRTRTHGLRGSSIQECVLCAGRRTARGVITPSGKDHSRLSGSLDCSSTGAIRGARSARLPRDDLRVSRGDPKSS